METKICIKCGIKKNINEFRKYRKKCKKCENLGYKEYYLKTREYKLQYSKNYREEHFEYYEEYRQKHKNKMEKYNKEYYIKNKNELIQKGIEYEKERSLYDYIYKLKKQLRRMIYNSFYRKNFMKKNNTEKIIGCNYDEFIKYLLQTYKNNYGYEWDGIEKIHIDHIIPLSIATTEKEMIKLCHYTNLQLLKEKDNLQKGCKLNWKLRK